MNPSTDAPVDPLLECLVRFAGLYHRPISREALIAGLPIDLRVGGPQLFSLDKPKGLFSRVARRAGFASRMVRVGVDDISSLVLPCILVLRDRKACILESVDRAAGRAKIILPEVGEGEDWISFDRLREEYLGFAFLLKKEYRYESRTLSLIRARRGHWFWGTMWRSRDIYISVLIASLVINLFVIATPLFTMNVYDRVVPHSAIETLWVLALGVMVVYVFDTVLRFIRTHFLEVAGKKSDVIMSSILYEQALNLRMDQWPPSVGSFANTLREFESIRSFFTSSTMLALIDMPFAVLFLIMVFYLGGPLAVVPLVAAAALIWYSFMLVRPLRETAERSYEASANRHALLVESLHTIRTIKTLGAGNHAQWEWEEASGEIARHSMRARNLSASITVVTHLLVQLTTAALVIAGVYLIKSQDLSLGGLIAIIILASRAIVPMGQVAGLIASYEQTRTAFNALEGLMNKQVERPEGKSFISRPRLEGEVELRHVDFAYAEGAPKALAGISFRVQPGERVGIIGKIGSGKSSLARLLIGLYAPGSGSVLVDGIDINQLDPAELRRNIAFLSQDVELLRGTIRENIAYKDPHVDDESLLAAASLGGVDLFVNRFPMGYSTPVGEQGVALSGGQRQCIALARALLLDAPILILDEPTSNMDNTSEAAVRQRLLDHAQGKTLILITHKGTMLDLVDRLIVMDEGRVVLDGPKAKVLKALQGEHHAA